MLKRKRLAPYLIIGIALTISGCMLKQPGSPKWEVEVTIPIADRVYSMFEIVTDSTEVDSSGNWVSSLGDTLFLNFADSLEKMTYEDELAYDQIDETAEAEVGTRTVNAPGIQTTDFHLPELDSLSGQTLPLAPFSFGPIWRDLGDYPEYDWAYLASGYATLIVTNNLPIPLENLDIKIYNFDPYYLLLEMFVVCPLAPGASAQETFPLPVGIPIDNRLEVQVNGDSPGSLVPVTITASDHIQIGVEISSLEVTKALAHFPAQSFNEDTTYALEESDTLKTAIIKEGDLVYTITNNTELITFATFTICDLTLEGQPFSDSFQLLPQETYAVNAVDLAGYQLNRPEQDNRIHALVEVEILDTADPLYGSPNSFVYIDQNQTVTTQFSLSELHFSHFEGVLDRKVVDIEEDPTILENIPGGLDSLQVELAVMEFHLSSVIEAEIEVNLVLQARSWDGILASFQAPPLPLPPGDTTNPGTLDTILTGLEPIVNAVPDYILPTGHSIISGPIIIEDWQWVEGFYIIYSPLSLSIGQSTLEPDVTIVDEGYDNRLNQVDVALYLESHVPLNGAAMILACYDSTQFGNPASTEVDTFLQAPLPQAVVDENGYVSAAGFSTEERTLSYDQLEMFAGASNTQPLYIQTIVTINSTQGDTVRFRPEDYLTVGASAHLLINMDFEEGEGGN